MDGKSTDNRPTTSIQVSSEISTPAPRHFGTPTSVAEQSQITSEIPKAKRRNNSAQPNALNEPGRKDRGSRHVVGGTVLSRSLLQTLEKRGENIRTLRRMEKELRTTLKPEGALGRLFFDRFWSSVLRLILVARLEEGGLSSQKVAPKNIPSGPSLREGRLPVLVVPEDGAAPGADLQKNLDPNSDALRRLHLVSRYDRSAAREMYRTMSFLLIMRSDGESGLESLVRATAGIKKDITGEDNNG